MGEETKKDEEVNQEELAAQWEAEAAGDSEEEKVDQDELAAQWEAEAAGGDDATNQEDLAAAWESQTSQEEKKENIESALPSFEDYQKSENSKLSLLMDIPLEVTVEIGSTEIPIEEILKLNPNSVIELDKMISEPVDLKVNGKLIAKGELYTVKNSFGIKITNIITPEDRMKLLNSE